MSLGVGKTTAILSLLDRLGKRERIAVLINEWGRVSLDSAVISSRHPGLAGKEGVAKKSRIPPSFVLMKKKTI